MITALIVIMAMAASQVIYTVIERLSGDDLEDSFLRIKNACYEMQRTRTAEELMEDKNYEELQRTVTKMQITLVRRHNPGLTTKRRITA